MQKYSKCNAHIGHCTFFVVSLGSYQEKMYLCSEVLK